MMPFACSLLRRPKDARAAGRRRSLVALSGWGACTLALFAVTIGAPAAAQAVGEAEAANKPHVTINVFISTRNDECYDRGDVGAIKRFTKLEQQRINQQGGIAGHPLDLNFLDDFRDVNRAVVNMREALSEPTAVAMVGLSSSDRAKAVFEATGAEIRDKQIPFLSAITVNSIFEDYHNVYTMRPSQDDERLPVLVQFVKRTGIKKTAFIGFKDNIFSTTLADGLRNAFGSDGLVGDHRLTLTDEKLDPAEVAAVIADMKLKAPDLVFLAIGGNRNGDFMKDLMAAGATPALFLTGRIDAIPAEISTAYPSQLYELAWDRLPEVYADRLLKRVALAGPEEWIFEGTKVSAAPGWKNGECKPRPDNAAPDPLSNANLRAIGNGTQYADMVALVAAAVRSADRNASIADLRAHILKQLGTTYASGRGVFQGQFDNWSFLPSSRTAAQTPFVVQLSPRLDGTQLAPLQFTRLRNETLRSINTLYLDIDLQRVLRVDDNEKSFFAEFYLSMRDDGKGASIDMLEFSNALLNPETNDRQITVQVMNDGGKSDAYPDDTKIYQVSGRFMYDPDLATYPFDTQRFAIDIRPKRGDAPFIVQPPPRSLRDQAVSVDGWEPRMQYVGYDEDFVSTVDAKSHEKSVVPFYKASFVWMMTRQTTDYFLRVVVPLMFILIVAYMSIFIPLTHFEAIVTIQVTALLSAVALYLSLPAVDAGTTTLSDRIFLFNYLAVSVMIGISVARINPFVTMRLWLQRALGLTHVIIIPFITALMAYYVYRASLAAV